MEAADEATATFGAGAEGVTATFGVFEPEAITLMIDDAAALAGTLATMLGCSWPEPAAEVARSTATVCVIASTDRVIIPPACVSSV